VAGIATLLTLTVCLYRCRQRNRQASAVDPELGGEGASSERGGRLVQAPPPPVPDLCPYNPQLGELASVGHSPTEQYASECRAARDAGTGGGGSRTYDVGGPSNYRRAAAQNDAGHEGTSPENFQAGTLPVSAKTTGGNLFSMKSEFLSPKISDDENQRKEETEDEKECDDDEDDDDDDDDDDEMDYDIEMDEINHLNNNISSSSNSTNRNNNNNDVNNAEDDEHVLSSSEEGLLSTSTISTESRWLFCLFASRCRIYT